MANKEVIQDFLAKLGFEVDEPGQKKMLGALESTKNAAVALSEALIATATAVAAAVEVMADKLEKIYYVSERSAASSTNIMALQYAFSRIGLTSEQATQAVESFASALRNNPGLQAFLKNGFGIEGGDNAEKMIELVQKLSRLPFYQGKQYANMFGIDEQTFIQLSLHGNEVIEMMSRRRSMLEAAGVDPEKATRQARELQNTLRDLRSELEILGLELFERVAPYLQIAAEKLEQFVNWLRQADTELGVSKTLFNLVQESISAVGGGLQKLEEIYNKEFANDIKVLGNNLKELFDHIMTGLKNLTTGTSGDFLEGLKSALHVILDLLNPIVEVLNFRFAEAFEHLKAAGAHFLDFGNSEKSLLEKMFQNLFSSMEPEVSDGPIGIRQRNPGNLRSWGDAAVQNGFAVFKTASEGLSAMAGQLIRYGQSGANTIDSIISKWAPSEDGNNVGAYIADIVEKTGFKAKQMLNMYDPATLHALMNAMIFHEQGQNPYSSDLIDNSIWSRLSMPSFHPSVNINQKTDIHVEASPNSRDTAMAISDEQTRVNADLLRNTRGVYA